MARLVGYGARSWSSLLLLLSIYGLQMCAPVEGRIMWSGGVTDDSAVIVVETDGMQEIRVSQDSALSNPIHSSVKAAGIHKITIGGLAERTKYYYGIPNVVVGQFETVTYSAYNFSFAMGNCADSGYNTQVFTELLEKNPKFLVHMGDLHYEDVDSDDVQERIEAVQLVFSSETQVRLLRWIDDWAVIMCAPPSLYSSLLCSGRSLPPTFGMTMILWVITPMEQCQGQLLLLRYVGAPAHWLPEAVASSLSCQTDVSAVCSALPFGREAQRHISSQSSISHPDVSSIHGRKSSFHRHRPQVSSGSLSAASLG